MFLGGGGGGKGDLENEVTGYVWIRTRHGILLGFVVVLGRR